MLRTGARLLAVQILRLELGLVALSAGLLAGLVMSLVLAAGIVAVLAGAVLALSEPMGMTASLLCVGGGVIVVLALSAALVFSVMRRRLLERTRTARSRAPEPSVSAVAAKISSSVEAATQEQRPDGDAFARFGGVMGLGAAAFSLVSVLGLRRTVGLTRLAATAVAFTASVPEVKAAVEAVRASIKHGPQPKAEVAGHRPAPPPPPPPPPRSNQRMSSPTAVTAGYRPS